MIDPIISLAYSIYTSKGVYALLLGSGMSRSAGILTGWEIVLDLLEKLAALEGEADITDAAAWYQQKHGEEPSYSELLATLCKSPMERQQMLSQYFEPTEEERESGLKGPTIAHSAIASLVAAGYIRVIITTNFDRLIEQALEAIGITPVVLSTTDAVRGSKPLVHQRCTIIKVHGDYLDPRIKNSPSELAAYDAEFNALLDQVFDEYGLIISGWSGDWDEALREAIDRTPNRRFPNYWAARGKASEKAQGLIERRQAIVMKITDADSFFGDLAEKVLALEEFASPHPLSVATAASLTKRFLSEDKYRIKLHDLVQSETEAAFARLQDELTTATYNTNVALALDRFRAMSELLRIACSNVAYFGNGFERLVAASIIRLTNDPLDDQSGTKPIFSLRAVPSLMLYYAAGITACSKDSIEAVIGWASAPVIRKYREDEPYIVALDWSNLNSIFQSAASKNRLYFPSSEWLFSECQNLLSPLIPDPSAFERQFNRFEALNSLLFLKLDGRLNAGQRNAWAPLGRFAYQSQRDGNTFLERLMEDMVLVDALISKRIFLSKQEVHQARDTLVAMIQARNLW